MLLALSRHLPLFSTSRFDHNHPHHLPRRTLVVATRRTTRKGRNDSSLELYGALAFLLSLSLCTYVTSF